MVKKNMTIRIEPELKARVSELFKELGLDLSTATGIFYRQALRCNGFPFNVKLNEPNEGTYAAIDSIDKNNDVYGPFDSMSATMEALDA